MTRRHIGLLALLLVTLPSLAPAQGYDRTHAERDHLSQKFAEAFDHSLQRGVTAPSHRF